MAITGIHTLFHTPDPEGVRAVLADAFGWEHIDMGGGWLIFALPPAEMGVHPTESAHHEISLMCDDLDATVADLRQKGVAFEGEPSDEGFGITITMVLPGDLRVTLYEPRHPTAI